jgi:radical SAM protein with 4Fe4S-binding SPASM domain
MPEFNTFSVWRWRIRAVLVGAWLHLRVMSLRRLWNAVLIYTSYGAARLTGRPVRWGLPISLGIEPTTACNLRCPHCPSGLRSFTRPTGRLQPGMLDSVVAELHSDLTYLVFYFQGEPYLNPHFTELVRAASARRLFVSSSTNAHFLTEEAAEQTVLSGLSHLIVSVDGLTQQTYEQYRVAGQLDTALDGIRRLVAAKRRLRSLTPLIEMQFIAFAHNAHEVHKVERFGYELGVDTVSIKTAQVLDPEHNTAWLPDREELRRYTQTADGWQIKNSLLNHCWKLWHSAEVTWDGQVLPCCFDKDAQYAMGRVPEQSFASIWRGHAYRDFRARLLTGRASIDMCRNCTEGTTV